MKKLFRHKGKLFLGLLLLVFVYAGTDNEGRNEYQPLNIITKEVNEEGEVDDSKKAKYYHVSANGFQREIAAFQSDDLNIFTLGNDLCEDRRGKSLVHEPVWIDADGNKVKHVSILNKILDQTLDIDHEFFSVKIFEDQKEYFVVYDLNVNWQYPFEICHYNQQKDKLEYITSFEGEDIIGLRLK